MTAEIVDALVGEIIRQYGSWGKFIRQTGINKSSLHRMRRKKTIGMKLLIELMEALDLELGLVNIEGVNIL